MWETRPSNGSARVAPSRLLCTSARGKEGRVLRTFGDANAPGAALTLTLTLTLT